MPKCLSSSCFVADRATKHNADTQRDETSKKHFMRGTCYYSITQEPTDKAGVYDNIVASATATMRRPVHNIWRQLHTVKRVMYRRCPPIFVSVRGWGLKMLRTNTDIEGTMFAEVLLPSNM
jgi:hypothetical protein